MTDARTDAKSAWNATGEQLTALGSKLGAHYGSQRGTDGQQARAETGEAIKRLGQAVQDAFEAVGTAAKDEAVRQDVKQVGRSLVGALEVTFKEVSTELRQTFDRKNAPADTAADPAASTTTDPAPPPAAAPTDSVADPEPAPTPAPIVTPDPGGYAGDTPDKPL